MGAAAVAAAADGPARAGSRAGWGTLPGGLGIGWRPEIAGVVGGRADLGFTEVVAEALAPADPSRGVTELRGRGVRVVPHGVRLSLGGTEPVDPARVTHLAACAGAVDAPLVSEHVAFVRAGGREAGHLLPVPRTREALDVLAANVARTRAELDVPLALEPIAALLDWPEDEMGEGEFLTRLLDRTGALLLLDVANVHANAVNRGQDARAVLDTLPLDRVAYVHVAGGTERDGLYHDTHTAPTPDPVLALLRDLVDRLPAPPPVMLERDGRYPPAAALHAELDRIRTAARLPFPVPTPASRRLSVRESAPERARVDTPTPRVPRTDTASSASGPASSAPRPASSASGPASSAPRPASSAPPHADAPRAAAGDLARREAALVAALVDDGDAPAGLDPGRLDAVRRALVRKRAGLAAGRWPRLAAATPDWEAVFAAHARPHGGAPPGPLRDGWDVARALHDAGALPRGAEAELAEREATLRYDGRSAPRSRLRTAAAHSIGRWTGRWTGRA